jgi:hypothetical protein
LVALLLVAFAPLLAAYGLWWGGWEPVSSSAQGQLLQPVMPLAQWWGPGEHPAPGHWLLVEVVPPACAAACRDSLDQLTRLQMALGKDAQRVRRLWLGDSLRLQGNDGLPLTADPYLLTRPAVPAGLPPGVSRFIVDPAGNLILAYAPGQPLQALLKDLRRLLRASQIG